MRTSVSLGVISTFCITLATFPVDKAYSLPQTEWWYSEECQHEAGRAGDIRGGDRTKATPVLELIFLHFC